MSTLKTTYLQHPSATSPNLELKADGTVTVIPNGVLQVVSTAKTDTFFTTSQSFTPVTGLSASITPSADTSKVLVLVQLAASTQAAAIHFQLLRGATVLAFRGDSSGSRIQGFGGAYSGADPDLVFTISATYLDSPATTSSTTYSVEARVGGNSFNGAYVNRSYTDTDNATFGRAASSITLIEIAG